MNKTTSLIGHSVGILPDEFKYERNSSPSARVDPRESYGGHTTQKHRMYQKYPKY